MNTIELIPKNFYKYKKKKVRKRFLLIGSDSIKHKRFLKRIILPKLKKEYNRNVPGFWATLGFADSNLGNWTGKLDVSEYGNDTIKGVGGKISEYIKELYDTEEGSRIIERFISFENSKIEFPDGEFTEAKIPVLRLTLMLGKEESAIVFYQHKDSETGEEFPEFIMPEATKGNNMDQRDRLTYYFKAIPKKGMHTMNKEKGIFILNEDNRKCQFKVKVITFSRKEFVDSNDFLNFNMKKVHCRGEHKTHCLLKYDHDKNDFDSVSGNDIDPSLKTLFLIHGTFANTAHSFNALYKERNEWLKKMLGLNGGKYEQIIAFDHPTITDDAKMNTKKLFELLGEGFKFENNTDIIATSQGGLLAQYLANYPFEETKLPVGKVVLTASANGVDYFKTGEHAAKFLTVMMHRFENSGKLIPAFITGLASQSASYFLNLPGSKQMTPGDPVLEDILSNKPAQKATCYLPIIGDFDKNSQVDSIFLKIVFSVLSVLVYPIMGKYNDLVVRTKNQYKIHKNYCCIPDYDPNDFKGSIISALHGHALDSDEVKEKIARFLTNDDCKC